MGMGMGMAHSAPMGPGGGGYGQRRPGAAPELPELPWPWQLRVTPAGQYLFHNSLTEETSEELPTEREYDVDFRLPGRLGITFVEDTRERTSAVISRIDPYSQAAGVGVDPAYVHQIAKLCPGHKVVLVNGTDVSRWDFNSTMRQLGEAGRPLRIRFRNPFAVPHDVATAFNREAASAMEVHGSGPAGSGIGAGVASERPPAFAPSAPGVSGGGGGGSHLTAEELSLVPSNLRHIYEGPFSPDAQRPNKGWTKEGSGDQIYYYHPETDTYSFTWPPRPL